MSERERRTKYDTTRRSVLAGLAAVPALSVTAGGASRDSNQSTGRVDAVQDETPTRFEYAVKFVCGISQGRVLAPGRYWTAINVHNPTDRPTPYAWKVAIAQPEDPGEFSEFDGDGLGRDEAVQIGCRQIRERSPSGGGLLEGFVVLRSDVELDVVAVYTVADEERQVQSIHTERVSARPRGERNRLN